MAVWGAVIDAAFRRDPRAKKNVDDIECLPVMASGDGQEALVRREEEDGPIVPYVVRVLGYCSLTASIIGIVWATCFVWVLRGAPEILSLFHWNGSLSPLVLAGLIGTPTALLSVAAWMKRRPTRRAPD